MIKYNLVGKKFGKLTVIEKWSVTKALTFPVKGDLLH
jgi:hypothetical protein